MFRHSSGGILALLVSALWAGQTFAITQEDIPSAGTTGGAVPDIQEIKPDPTAVQDVPVIQDERETHAPGKPGQQPLINTKALRIQGVVEHPQQGITKKSIQALATKLFRERLHGRTGLTLDEIWSIADALSLHYRQKGFILTRAYVPAQDLEDRGIVTIKVHEGVLGKVVVEDSKLYEKSAFTTPLESLRGHAVLASTLESKLLQIHSYPGLKVRAIFRPGDNPGETDLVLKPSDENRYDAVFAFDNTGNQLTGPYHGVVNFQVNNPLGAADLLNFTVVDNFDPRNGTFGAVSYDHPINFSNTSVGFNFNRNRFTLGGNFAATGVTSTAVTSEANIKHHFIRTRTRGLQGSFKLQRIVAQTHLGFGDSETLLNKDSLTVLVAGFNYHRRGPKPGTTFYGGAHIYHGISGLFGALGPEVSTENNHTRFSRSSSGGKSANGDFTRLTYNMGYVYPLPDQQSILFKVNGQYSKSLLVPLQQFSLGGANNIRAYPVSEYLVDSGLATTLEWSMAAPGFADKHAYGRYTWGQLLHVSAFFDAGFGERNDPTNGDKASNEDTVTVMGYGLGLRYHVNDKIVMKVQAAKPVSFSRKPSDDKDTRYWFTISYHV